MIKLSALEGKKVRLYNKSGSSFVGVVGDYIHPEDNEPEEVEAIVLDYPIRDDGYRYEYPVEFTSAEIKKVEEL